MNPPASDLSGAGPLADTGGRLGVSPTAAVDCSPATWSRLYDELFRSERWPLAHGEQVKRTVPDDGRPAEARFRFEVPLGSPSLLWLCFRETTFESFGPPP